MLKLKNLAIAASALVTIAMLGCTSEVVREVSVVSEVVRDVTVIVEKPVEVAVEVPVPQTVIVEKVVDNKILETVVVPELVEVIVPVEREVIVEVPVEVTVEVPVPQTVITEIWIEPLPPETIEVTVEVPVIETVIVEKPVTVEVPVTVVVTATPTALAVPPLSQTWNREVVIGLPLVRIVNGLPTVGPYFDSQTRFGGVEEYFFHYENGNPMTPELVEAWDIDPAGTRLRMTMRKGPSGSGIPFNSPVGYEDIDFGVVNATEVVRYFNESNSTTYPDTTYGNSDDLAALFWEARTIDEWTVEIGLTQPVFSCLPITQFGCSLNMDRGLFYLAHADTMGEEWAKEHHIGTGPFVQEQCNSVDSCVTRALKEHWRSVPDISTFTQLEVGEPDTRAAMIRNGELDMAWMDFKEITPLIADGFRFLETMPGGYIGQSILFPGNLWEHSHSIEGDPLAPWDCDPDSPEDTRLNSCGEGYHAEGPYLHDYPWIGNPWGTQDAPCADGDAPGRERCGNAPYADTDNPGNMDDMAQARLVRYALSVAIDRHHINETFLFNMGAPLYSEYMGPLYPGWDQLRNTGCWNWLGEKISCETTIGPDLSWEIPGGSLELAATLLDLAGYPLVDGRRQGFKTIVLQSYLSEAGAVSMDVAKYITDQWRALGIEIDELVESYGGVTSQRMRRRAQYYPVLKNGLIYSNIVPLDWQLPDTDSSISRPGWGVGFESQAAANWYSQILSAPDKATRERLHLDWVDYSMFWMQSAGVFQIPKGVIAGPRIANWIGRQEHFQNISTNPEFIVLRF